jgi:hypothetical protein
MIKARTLIVGLLALWLVIGPVAGVPASADVDTPCENMAAMPGMDGCCDTAAVSCAAVCAASAPAMAFARADVPGLEIAVAPIPSVIARYASQAASPDLAPPKRLVS